MTAPARILPVRRLLRRPEAAVYVGVSPTTFDGWIEDGRMPGGHTVGRVVVWDVRALDEAVDAMLYGAAVKDSLTHAPTKAANPWPDKVSHGG